MKTNKTGIDLIKSFEGLRLNAYMPTPDDVPTIGYGHTGPDVRLGQRITHDKAEEIFLGDLALFENGVSKLLGSFTATENQFSAMVSLAFRIGLGQFKTSSVLARHKEGKYKLAQAAFMLWNKQNGKVLAGSVRRGKAESELYGKQ